MCEYEIYARLCACNDRRCKLKVTELGEDEDTYEGHIIKVLTCYRISQTCLGMFTNTDPDRPLVKFGMLPENGNSKQDCKNAVYYFSEKTPPVCVKVYKACLLVCDWKGNPSSSKTGSVKGE
ncbi:hypothetical protein LLEC1_05690 [Akanthomyces lecanii]|uniref:Uncharacterized protein n=1 Tax=Cordyceps confragosa TaxID=2714763 RepID=A0A179II79_CORDF|nr:hypothetical protein LLEC1_05690 [Akanthomyces lecanii]